MKFTLKINCDNAAFMDGELDQPNPGPELARILGNLAGRMDGCDPSGDSWRLMDFNGNHVGEAKLQRRGSVKPS